jgi:phage terminase large subunit-like protein
MKTKTCPGLGIQPPKKSAFTIETAPDFFRMHMLALFFGKRGGGKSVAVANLIRLCKERGYLDRVILITPTFESNKEIWQRRGPRG